MSSNEYEGFIRVIAPTEAKARVIATTVMQISSARIDHVVDAGPSSVPGSREFRFYTKA
jgi:hypothetical protein